MAHKLKEDRRIPDLNLKKANANQPFDASDIIESEDFICFGISPEKTRALALKIISPSGEIALIQYSRMIAPISFNGSDRIKLGTPSLLLEITGENLVPLMDYIAVQRLVWIKKIGTGGETEAFMLREGEPEITSINVSPKRKKVEDK